MGEVGSAGNETLKAALEHAESKYTSMSERYGMLVDKREITEARRRQQVMEQETVTVKARVEAYEKTTPRFSPMERLFHMLHLQQDKWYIQMPSELATPCRIWKD